MEKMQKKHHYRSCSKSSLTSVESNVGACMGAYCCILADDLDAKVSDCILWRVLHSAQPTVLRTRLMTTRNASVASTRSPMYFGFPIGPTIRRVVLFVVRITPSVAAIHPYSTGCSTGCSASGSHKCGFLEAHA
jgi:hypothetical protein